MRITAEEKLQTRDRIVQVALQLFSANGFDATTTREIAQAAQIATGTLFNYFDTKESIVAWIAEQAVANAREQFFKQAVNAELHEELFALIAAELRSLKPLRTFINSILETLMYASMGVQNASVECSWRASHLENITQIARKHGITQISAMSLQIYWTLYTGVLAFWGTDSSRKQESTLALLDQSLRMFSDWLQGTAGRSKK